MAKQVKLKIDLTKREITSDYVFDTLFKISEKSKTLNHAEIAKEIIKLVAIKGKSGLYEEDWKEVIERFQIPKHVYFNILKRLKDAGLVRKSLGKYYLLWTFTDHLNDMATSLTKLYQELGITRREK